MTAKAKLEIRRRDFHRFVEKTFPDFTDGWVYRDLCERLRQFMLDIRAGKSPRLIVCLPPRMGKSQITSIRFALWCLLNNPRWEIIVASYGQSLSNRFSRFTRSLMESHPYIETLWPDIRLASGHEAVEEWKLERKGAPSYLGGGTYRAVGRGSAITGSGAHCFVSGTRVACNGCFRNIEDVRPGDLVLSLNHRTGSPEWKPVLATSERKTCGEIYTIRTEGNKKFQCTSDHRIFSGDRYQVASACSVGDGLVALAGVPGMYDVSEDIHGSPLRSDEKDTKGIPRPVLFCELLGGAPRGKESQEMHSLWREHSKENPEILSRVPGFCELQGAGPNPVPNLSEDVPAETQGCFGMLNGLQESASLTENEGGRESKVCCGEVLHSSVSENYGSDFRARRQYMPSLRVGSSTDSSHRPQQGEQCSCQFNLSLQKLPCHAPQVTCDAISSIERDSFGEVSVYDIQVEGNHNFFAEGILVHNCLICDDTLKDFEEAESLTTRGNLWDWYSSTARTRLSPGGGVVIVQTRWHPDDLVGRLLQEEKNNPEADKWELVEYRALAEEDEPQRKAGESILPARWSAEELKKTKANMVPRWWDALYQQRPVARGGNLFKEMAFRRYLAAPALEEFDQIIQVWDLRFGKSQAKTSSFVVGWIIGRKDAQFYVLDEARDRWSYAESRDQLRWMTERWPQAIAKIIENKANGPAIESDLETEIPGIVLFDPKGDKYQRAERVLPLCLAGNVYLPADEVAPWAKEALQEIIAFPRGADDDRVDVLSMGLGWFMERDAQRCEVIPL
jgi:predicted phage terminase large subunit-like protein